MLIRRSMSRCTKDDMSMGDSLGVKAKFTGKQGSCASTACAKLRSFPKREWCGNAIDGQMSGLVQLAAGCNLWYRPSSKRRYRYNAQRLTRSGIRPMAQDEMHSGPRQQRGPECGATSVLRARLLRAPGCESGPRRRSSTGRFCRRRSCRWTPSSQSFRRPVPPACRPEPSRA